MKKAQVTTFISIAVVLIIAVALFLFIRAQLSKDIEPERVVPIEMMDIDDFVHDCLRLVSRNGIELLGLQGGYIYLPEYISMINDAHVRFIPGSDLKIPLWYYMGNFRMPLLPEMEDQLNRYIIENLPLCINNFNVFENKYDVIDDNIQPNVFISSNDVLVNLKYPLKVTNLASGQIAEIDKFTARHDVKLKRAYDLAYDILLSNNVEGYLEYVAIDLMVIDPEIPFSGLDFSCKQKTWRLNSIIERTKGLFSYNLPLVRIKQTDYISFSEDEQYESLHMLWDMSTGRNYKDFKATIDFNPQRNFFMYANPSDGEIMRSSRGEISFLNMFCINNYHFTYDLRFPLVFRLYNEESFSGTGFEFVFSLPLYVESNLPLREDFGTLQSQVVEEDEEFCSFKRPETHIFRAYDKRYGLGIENVEFYFDCITKRCYLGNSTFDGFNFQLEASLPEYCTGGFLVAQHPDYEEARELFYYEDLPHPISVTMQEMKTLNLLITRHRSSNLILPFSISEEYNVILSLKDKSNNKTTYLSYPIGNDTIRLPYDDSSLHLELFLVDDSEFILGGYDNEFNYTRDEIADSNILKLRVYEHDPAPITHEQSMQIFDFIKNQTKEIEILKPRLEYENE